MDELGVGRAGLALRLRYAERRLELRLLPALREHDLTMDQGRVLSVLLDRPGIAMSLLAEAAVIPAASLTRNVDRLVDRALVVRRVDSEDKRRLVTALSTRGRSVALRLRAVEASVERQLSEELGAERFLALSGGLEDLERLLD